MITLQGALEMLNGKYTCEPFIEQWREIYYRTSIHTSGACPRFFPLRDNRSLDDKCVFPAGWVNAHYDRIFDTHLINKHAREPEITRQWRKSVYRPYQMDPLLKCISTTSACIFGDSKYTLTIEDKDDSDYINGNNFSGKTFIGYFEWMFKAICEDPNSLFLVVPKEPGYKTTTDKVEPDIKHIPSRFIHYINDKEIVYFEPCGNYAWLVNDIGYFRFEKREGQFYPMDAQVGYYAHLLYYRPAHFAGGIWNTHRYYDSYLKSAQAFCDDFVPAHSDVQMINKEASHPFIIAVDKDCPTCNGHKQVQYCKTCRLEGSLCRCEDDLQSLDLVNCASCNGTGRQAHSPADWIVVPKGDMDMANSLIQVVQFDVSANVYLDKHADKILLGIKKALHQQHIEEAQSGTAKDIDRQAEQLYRSTVSNGVWALIEKCLIDVLSIRNTATIDGKRRPDIPKFILVKPTDFDLKTEQDLLAEFAESTKANTPAWVQQRQIEQYVDKVFGGDDVMKRKASLINQMDAFSVTPIADKINLLQANGISQGDFQFSNLLPKMLDQVVRVKGSTWFVTSDYDDINTEVEAIFKSVVKLEKPQPATLPAAA